MSVTAVVALLLGKKISVLAVLGLFVVSFSSLGGLPAVNAATTITVNSSWCSGAGFSWNAGTLTCTVTGAESIPAGDTLAIPSATTLTIGSGGSLSLGAGFLITLVSESTVTIDNSIFPSGLAIYQSPSACGTDTISGDGGSGTLGSGSMLTSATACAVAGVPEFPASSLFGPLTLVAFLLPVLLLMRRQFNRPPAV
jgi:hypothetical protein